MCCSLTGKHSPALALNLIRFMTGLIFVLPGFGKLMDAAAFQGMLTGMFGVEGVAAMVLAWVVIVFEVAGGLFLILGSKVPRILYKVSNLGLMVIVLVGMYFATKGGAANMMQILFHVLLFVNLIGLAVSKPMCCAGITGCKDGECGMKKDKN